MHSKRPSIKTEVPLILGLSKISTSLLKSAKVLLIPNPELSDAEDMVSLLDSFTSEWSASPRKP